MNRYPSSADLAAFRADINRRNGGAWLRPDPRDGGAHMFERLHGCPEWPPASQTASLLRREAAALRSRAYDRLLEAAAGDLEWADSEAKYRDVLDAYALDTFAPRR